MINLNIIDTTGLWKYPAFKNLVINLPDFLNKHSNVLDALSYYTGFTKTKIMQLMQPGIGPKMAFEDFPDPNKYGQYDTLELGIQPGQVYGTGINRNNAIDWVKFYPFNLN